MPIVVESVSVEKYVNWVAVQLNNESWLIDKVNAVQNLMGKKN
jgi:hypothetical protein